MASDLSSDWKLQNEVDQIINGRSTHYFPSINQLFKWQHVSELSEEQGVAALAEALNTICEFFIRLWDNALRDGRTNIDREEYEDLSFKWGALQRDWRKDGFEPLRAAALRILLVDCVADGFRCWPRVPAQQSNADDCGADEAPAERTTADTAMSETPYDAIVDVQPSNGSRSSTPYDPEIHYQEWKPE